jgi:hypothetical protein
MIIRRMEPLQMGNNNLFLGYGNGVNIMLILLMQSLGAVHLEPMKR